MKCDNCFEPNLLSRSYFCFLKNLKEHAKLADKQTGVLDDITTKGCVTIQTLQRENREAREKIIDLESRLRCYLALANFFFS